MNEAREEAMGTSTDTKAPDVSLSYAADTAKEGLKRATDLAKEESGDAATEEAGTVAGGEEESEENMTVGEIGTVKRAKSILKLKNVSVLCMLGLKKPNQ
ncbi:unnamed protein product [Arabidopsis lyrata]|nr:uncharacterized protein LOC9300365 [Arabidopsis lyrata subsp. lyrata]CAH8279575.1 unnamed protein product [Arabidopsis lyrata]|eukprot:XP_020885285.1 uncharacterized protein LOC9300365 [Arabidopsis lyrata subsp. lyrata]